MKKVFRFLKSMKFGMLLLTLIIVFSLAGSLIIQGNDASYYEQTYPSVSSIILTLGFDRVFSTWYYVALMALLCVNLVLCSVIRLNNVIKQSRGALVSAQKAPLVRVSKKEQERIHAALQARHLKRMPVEGGVVYHRNYPFGYYGSFLTHFGLLLTLVFAGCAMWLASTEDHSLAIGQTVNLYDGVSITLDQFRLKDEEGHIDYVSNIHVTDANGNDSGPQEVSVNYPHSFGGPKYFQQGYGAIGSMTITNDGKSDTILLDGPMFLSLDGVNGVAFHTLYPDHAVDENGQVTPLQSADYKNPVYLVAVTSDKETTMGVVMPGVTLEVNGVYYQMDDPVYTSTIRVKTLPPAVLGILYVSFAVLTFGLYICFFMVPVFVCVKGDGYSITSPKQTNDIIYGLGISPEQQPAKGEQL